MVGASRFGLDRLIIFSLGSAGIFIFSLNKDRRIIFYRNTFWKSKPGKGWCFECLFTSKDFMWCIIFAVHRYTVSSVYRIYEMGSCLLLICNVIERKEGGGGSECPAPEKKCL